MLYGLVDDDVENYHHDHLKIIPLFDIDIVEAVNAYVTELDEENQDTGQEIDPKSLEELRQAHETLEG